MVLLDPIKEHLERQGIEGNALAEHAHTMAHTCIQKNTINNLVLISMSLHNGGMPTSTAISKLHWQQGLPEKKKPLQQLDE